MISCQALQPARPEKIDPAVTQTEQMSGAVIKDQHGDGRPAGQTGLAVERFTNIGMCLADILLAEGCKIKGLVRPKLTALTMQMIQGQPGGAVAGTRSTQPVSYSKKLNRLITGSCLLDVTDWITRINGVQQKQPVFLTRAQWT